MCLSLILSFFSPSLSLPCTPCCMWPPQGGKGQPGEKVSPHFPLRTGTPASASTSWTLGGASRGPHALLLAHRPQRSMPARPTLPSQPLTAQFPNSFHTIGQESWDSWTKVPASLAEGVSPAHRGCTWPLRTDFSLRQSPFPEARRAATAVLCSWF